MENITMKQLALAVYNKQVPANYELTDMEGALREKFRELAPNYNAYQRNKIAIFELIGEVVDAVMPEKIINAIGAFAEVKSYAQGNKPRFKKKLGRNNVKRFITKVGLGGVYERVRLDSEDIDVTTHAYGGAVYIELEQYLDGNIDFTELTNLLIDGIEMAIYEEVRAALIATYSSLPAANKHTDTNFDAAEMRRILTTVKAYGGNATIICTPEFAGTITPDSSFVGDADKADKRDQGYIGRFEGANVVVLPQSFEDETNATKVFNPAYAFIVPTGGSADEKVVKVLLEGETRLKESENADDSIEIKAYKKLGMVVLNTNYFGIYYNSSLV